MDILFYLYWLFNGGPLTPLREPLAGSYESPAGSLGSLANS
ncbi:hypothetical protein M2280_006085 [Prescottella agglutinans]|uniref:Uncharacterized protein n=1 Tax=Prescottella agglutinans TaxID=1644129 RepID=A0ABT6MKG6_9NOCA|nr:hypothetical protein [Prescottella agglutinans]